MGDAQHKKCFLSSAVLFAARFAAKTSDVPVEIAEVSMKFGADFARDTRPAPAETVQKSPEGVARPARHVHCFCAPLPRLVRAFGAKIAQFVGRNSRDFACNFFFALLRASGRKRKRRPIQKHKSSLRGRCTTCAASVDPFGVVCRAFCRRNFRLFG